MRRIVVLGDSLSLYPSFETGFPAQLQAMIAKKGKRSWTMSNAGKSGETTTRALGRVGPLLGADVAVLIVELGANDGLRGVPLATIETNLSSIIEQAQEKGIRVLLCGFDVPPTHGWNYTMGFRQIFPRLATKYTIPLVPYLLTGETLDSGMEGPDAIRPNEAAAIGIAETIWPYLRPLLRR